MKHTNQIDDDVLAVLGQGSIDGDVFRLPDHRLDRKMYTRCNEVLTALGGKWTTKRKGHVFPSVEDAQKVVQAITSRSFANPKSLGFFETPVPIAALMVANAELDRDTRVLEPSAGEGALVSMVLRAGAEPSNVHCVEIDPARAGRLRRGGLEHVTEGDFLALDPSTFGQFDVVLMNPPFAVPGDPRADITHVQHALSFVRPGGKLIAVMAAGVTFRKDKKTQAFKQALSAAGTFGFEPLPAGAFKESGTAVATVLLTGWVDES